MQNLGLSLAIPIANNQFVDFAIYPERGQHTLQKISEIEALEFGEAVVQLQEGSSYEYQIEGGYQLREIRGVVKHSQIKDAQSGRITPGIYTGTLEIEVMMSEEASTVCGLLRLEVRSIKSSYREDYRVMLEEIAEKSIELLMTHSSPTTQTFTQDYSDHAQTLYQKFAFVQSIVGSSEFLAAVQQILISPTTRWVSRDAKIDIRRAGRMTGTMLRQIASGTNRIPLPPTHSLRHVLKTVPANLTARQKYDMPDTVENRFVKHVLSVFNHFCANVRDRLLPSSRAYREARQLEETLTTILQNPLFRYISQPTTLALNSTVLQRQEGYRQVLRAWLMFDLASKLIWKGGDDVYRAGKRDVATLYEYWLFFKLLDLFSRLFSIEPALIEKLIEPTSEGLGLKLKAGRHLPLDGVFDGGSRRLRVKFSYNRTFSAHNSYPSSGSWTKAMRPDYTLSIWPAQFSEREAEAQEVIIHLHFDAKYKVAHFQEIFGKNQAANVADERLQQKRGIYKNADLLKMHAYKDAVRRTVGAYVLYPGTEAYMRVGFHELIPGLGAFPIRPSKTDDGTKELKQFVLDVIQHVLDRSSQRERLSYHVYDIHKQTQAIQTRQWLPELDLGRRMKPPSEVSVLIGYCESTEQYEWMKKNGLYNMRINNKPGSLRVGQKEAAAEYLLIYHRGHLKTDDLWRIIKSGPRIFSRSTMIKVGYQNPSGEFYLVYDVKKVTETEFSGVSWDVSQLERYTPSHSFTEPFAISMTEMMQAVCDA